RGPEQQALQYVALSGAAGDLLLVTQLHGSPAGEFGPCRPGWHTWNTGRKRRPARRTPPRGRVQHYDDSRRGGYSPLYRAHLAWAPPGGGPAASRALPEHACRGPRQ